MFLAQVADYMLGFFVCTALGCLFVVVMVTSGVVFCCCRMTGRCGGEMVHKQTKHDVIYRRLYALTLTVMTIFLG